MSSPTTSAPNGQPTMYTLSVTNFGSTELNAYNLISQLEMAGAKIVEVFHGFDSADRRTGQYRIVASSLRNTFAHGIACKAGWTACLSL